MSYFYKNNIAIETPAGSIFAFLGTTDPEGWVICDGTARTYTSKYDGVVSMSIGTKDVGTNTYTPPNLSSKMIRGGTPKTTGGSDTVTLTTANIPSHNHSVEQHAHTVTAHTHTVPAHTHTVPEHSHTTSNHSHNMQHRHNIDKYVDDSNFSGGSSQVTTVRSGEDANAGAGRWETISYSRTSGLFNNAYTANITNTGSSGAETLTAAASVTGSNGDATTSSSGELNTNTGGPTATGFTGSAATINILPAYFSANWILKL